MESNVWERSDGFCMLLTRPAHANNADIELLHSAIRLRCRFNSERLRFDSKMRALSLAGLRDFRRRSRSWNARLAARSALRFFSIASSNRLRAMRRFIVCERASCTVTLVPLGRCDSVTAVETLFTCCPPGPEARAKDSRTSAGLIPADRNRSSMVSVGILAALRHATCCQWCHAAATCVRARVPVRLATMALKTHQWSGIFSIQIGTLSCLLVLQTATAQTSSPTPQPIAVPSPSAPPADYALRWGVQIPMRDKAELNATLYLPKAKQPSSPLRTPVIFTLTPYISDSYHARAAYFA